MRIGLVDLDGILYAAACVTEKVYYVLDGVRFEYKTQANDYADENNLSRADIEQDVDAEPVSHAISILQDMVPSNLTKSQCDVGELYITPGQDDNDHPFRFDIYPEYKANRKGKHKPVHLKALRAYAVKHMGAVRASNMEADDMIAIRAAEIMAEGVHDFCIITRDKDLKQIPGDFYNHETHKGDTVTISKAQENLFTQVLVGDTVDNIKGCPGIGPAKATKALKHCENEEEFLGVCRWLYMQSYVSLEFKAIKAEAKELCDDETPREIDYPAIQAKADAELRLNFRLIRMITNREQAKP